MAEVEGEGKGMVIYPTEQELEALKRIHDEGRANVARAMIATARLQGKPLDDLHKEAADKEDYELAAKIRNEIGKEQKD